MQEDEYKSNVVTALKSAEEKEKADNAAVVATAPTAATVKKSRGKAGKASEDKKRKRPTKKTSKKESGGKKKKTEKLPEELLLDDDGDDDDDDVIGRQNKTTATTAGASPSPTNIDKELSAIGIDDCMMNLNGDGDYLSNLSFRKSYDLEQMFSFMKSPKSSMKETAGNAGGGGMMDLKFGSMSFTNSFLMSGSGEERDGGGDPMLMVAPRGSSPRNELKMRPSHRRQSSNAMLPRQASRSSPALGIPTIHTLTSQNSSLGLTPINSFSNDNGPIVPLTSHDGMALTAMFASSPTNVPPANHGEAAFPPQGMPMQQHTQGPPPAYEYSYRQDSRHPARSGPPPPSQVPGPVHTPPLGPLPAPMSTGLNKRIKIISMASPNQPLLDVTKRSDLYVLLKRLAPVFAGFQFKLSETDSPLPVDSRAYPPTENQLTIAQRRINSSICAFGGSVPRRTVSFESDTDLTSTQKMEKEEKKSYEKNISSRYFMKEHCISWDVEVHDMIDPRNFKVATTKDDPSAPNYSAPVTPTTPSQHNLDKDTVLGVREKGKKVKYRCKLCGQPKQNHTCPYTSTVVRSIGTMVYTSVNAFVSDEPGKLAPALSEMNNFTSLLSQDMSANTYRHYSNAFNLLTPDSHWSPNTPGAMSAISTPSTPGNQKRDHFLMSRTMSGVSAVGGVTATTDPDALFRGTMELKPEQYRRVRFKADPKDDPYQYPHIPTPYSQRKEMGDTLFALSREVPKLADSCASILRSARENDRWDQAVAELTTQVLIVLKCEEQDYTLEGLKRHLLTLGIAC